MNRLTPPPRLPAPDTLDSELREMSIASERGFVRFPPPPPPVDRAALARMGPNVLAKVEPIDVIRVTARVLLWLVFAALALGAWLFWRSLFG